MQSEKRRTLEYYFLSSNKKPRNNEQEIEPNTVISLSLSTPEIQDLSCSFSIPSDQTSTDCILRDPTSSLILSSFLNENSHRKSLPNDISMSCNDVQIQKRTSNVSNKSTKSFIINLAGLMVEYGWNTRYKMMLVIAIIVAIFLRIN